ncbi:hypothetical protein ACF3M1_15035 [Luteimonas sp. WGS1318]|uniref:hypothetical protein n=1 Tax=Luteimonas sp. WGS1318 TaxID=3366815 RepID=UPI00372D6E95
MDRNDPELVREIARKHWEAINHAAATGGDLAAAYRPQEEFLDRYIPSLPPDIAKNVSDAYTQESVAHLAQFARITEKQTKKIKDAALTAKRIKTNIILFSAVMVVLLLLKIASMMGAV